MAQSREPGPSTLLKEPEKMEASILIKPVPHQENHEAHFFFKVHDGIVVPTARGIKTIQDKEKSQKKAADPKTPSGNTSEVPKKVVQPPPLTPMPLQTQNVATHMPKLIPAPEHFAHASKTPAQAAKPPSKVPILCLQRVVAKTPTPIATNPPIDGIATKDLSFGFGTVFEESTSVKEIYEQSISAQLKRAIEEGQDTVVFPYGEQGTGKTRFILGEKGVKGVFELAAEQINAYVVSKSLEWKYSVTVGVFEGYKNVLLDLNTGSSVKCRTDDGKYYPMKYKEEKPVCMKDWARIIKLTQERRLQAKSLGANKQRQRSSLMIFIQVQGDQLKPTDNEHVKQTTSVIYLLDPTVNEQFNIARAAKQVQDNGKNVKLLVNKIDESKCKVPCRKMKNGRDHSIIQLLEHCFQGAAKLLVFCCVRLNDYNSRRTMMNGFNVSQLPFYGKIGAPFCMKRCLQAYTELKAQHKFNTEQMKLCSKILGKKIEESSHNLTDSVQQNNSRQLSRHSSISEPSSSNSSQVTVPYLSNITIARLKLEKKRMAKELEELKQAHKLLIERCNHLQRQLEDEQKRRVAQCEEKDLEILKLQKKVEKLQDENALLKKQLKESAEKFDRDMEELMRKQEEEDRKMKEEHQSNIKKLWDQIEKQNLERNVPVNEAMAPSAHDEVVLDERDQEGSQQVSDNSQASESAQEDDLEELQQPPKRGRGRPSKEEPAMKILFLTYIRDMSKTGAVEPKVTKLLNEFGSHAFWSKQIKALKMKTSPKDIHALSDCTIKFSTNKTGINWVIHCLRDRKFSEELINLYEAKSAENAQTKNRSATQQERETRAPSGRDEPVAGPSGTRRNGAKPCPLVRKDAPKKTGPAFNTRSKEPDLQLDWESVRAETDSSEDSSGEESE